MRLSMLCPTTSCTSRGMRKGRVRVGGEYEEGEGKKRGRGRRGGGEEEGKGRETLVIEVQWNPA